MYVSNSACNRKKGDNKMPRPIAKRQGYKSLPDLLNIFGVTRMTLRKWIEEGTIPAPIQTPTGTYYWADEVIRPICEKFLIKWEE
jgi:predicted DNA-binding transcriptional regulator AlpA